MDFFGSEPVQRSTTDQKRSENPQEVLNPENGSWTGWLRHGPVGENCWTGTEFMMESTSTSIHLWFCELKVEKQTYGGKIQTCCLEKYI